MVAEKELEVSGIMKHGKGEPCFNNVKKTATIEETCLDCPCHITEFFKYTKDLKFEQAPDYKYCIGIFQKFLNENKFEIVPDQWDWDIQRQKCIKEKERKIEAQRVDEALKKIPKKNVK